MDPIKIPTKVEETLKDLKWTEAMHIEMEGHYRKIIYGTLLHFLKEKNQWDANGCLPSNTRLMEQSIGTRQG